MNRSLVGVLVLVASVGVAQAQQSGDQPFAPQKKSSFEVESLVRQEWTTKFFDETMPTASRQRGRLLPRLMEGGDKFSLGVGGDFNYSSDDNTDPKGDGTKPPLMRDNYKSRSARLDLAFAHIQPLSWLALDGGLLAMPFALTEMTWDKDLRVQGGAVRLMSKQTGDVQLLSLGAAYTQGSHVFDDGKARALIINATARFKAGEESSMELTGSYFDWKNLSDLESMIRRQNTRATDGTVPDQYRIADVVGRIKLSGTMPLELVGDYAWNTKISAGNRGIWLSAILGSLSQSRARAEYTYASIDRDAVVAAYNTDDFYWNTGWQGHRLDLGTRVGDRATLHGIAQIQRFKDSTLVEERDHWLQRFRIEMRVNASH
jgi:hypothetical protein